MQANDASKNETLTGNAKMFTYIVMQKRGNKPSVAVSSFTCDYAPSDKSSVKEQMYRQLWLCGIQQSGYKKYTTKLA
jgi:hypothetical protein